MSRVFIIGLPKALRTRLEGAARNQNYTISSVLAVEGERGSLRLVPFPERAVLDLRAYFDELEALEDAFVLVLPYTKLPDCLNEELDTLKELGGRVARARQGIDGWQKFPRTRLDQTFLDSVFRSLTDFLFPMGDLAPSEYYRRIAARNGQIVIPDGALDSCDEVAQHRYKFLKAVADAFDLYASNGGSNGRIDAFFDALGLDHAQSGGINATLEVHRGGICVHRDTSNTHLKQGDNTTRIAAARVYYQNFILDNFLYVAVLYVGPHPDTDVTRAVYLN